MIKIGNFGFFVNCDATTTHGYFCMPVFLFFALEKVSPLMNLYLETSAIVGVYIMMELCIVFNWLKLVFKCTIASL